MPVHRMPGAKGRVFAFVEELETWRDHEAEVETAAGSPPIPVVGPPAAVRKQWWRWALGGVIALIAVLGAAWALRPKLRPSRSSIEGNAVVVFDDDGREAWRFQFPSVPLMVGPESRTSFVPAQFVDVDGDGRDELLFPLHHSELSSEDDELYLFSPDGALRWKKKFWRRIRLASGWMDGPYNIRSVALIRTPGVSEARILVSSTHRVSSPTVVSLVDLQGNVLREYWHSGHFERALASDLDGDGKPEIYLAGVANGYSCADLVVLDPERFDGASEETDPVERIVDEPAPVEIARVLLPRSRVNQALEPYNGVGSLIRTGDSLVVSTYELPSHPEEASITFYFSRGLALQSARPADISRATYHELHLRKVIPFELTQEEVDSYRKIRVLTPWHR